MGMFKAVENLFMFLRAYFKPHESFDSLVMIFNQSFTGVLLDVQVRWDFWGHLGVLPSLLKCHKVYYSCDETLSGHLRSLKTLDWVLSLVSKIPPLSNDALKVYKYLSEPFVALKYSVIVYSSPISLKRDQSPSLKTASADFANAWGDHQSLVRTGGLSESLNSALIIFSEQFARPLRKMGR